MKKIIIFPLLALALVLPVVALTGCSGGQIRNDEVRVILINQVSLNLIDERIMGFPGVYRLSHFDGHQVTEVTHVLKEEEENVMQQRLDNFVLDRIDQSTFMVELRLRLSSPSRSTARAYARVLSERNDVYYASTVR